MESVLLERYRPALQGAVLELVPGGSRLTEELVHQARAYLGVGPSTAVINVCRQMYLNGRFQVAQLDDLEQFEPGSFDAVFAGRCAIDGLGEERRRRLFAGVRRLLSDGGLWIFSSHNADSPALQEALERSSGRQRGGLLRGLRMRSSRAPMDEGELGSEILSGLNGELSADHYRIGSDAQETQLGELGFRLVECVDLEGHAVALEGPPSPSAELHYVARPVGRSADQTDDD